MRINLLGNYGGQRTGEKRILPGEYDSEDPAIFGLADYLVENGHAVVIGELPPIVPDADALTLEEQDELKEELVEHLSGGVGMDDVEIVPEPKESIAEPTDDKPKKSSRKK